MIIEKLTKQEAADPLWLKIEEHLKAAIQEIRELNDLHTSEADTAHNRGVIHAYKTMLTLRPPENE